MTKYACCKTSHFYQRISSATSVALTIFWLIIFLVLSACKPINLNFFENSFKTNTKELTQNNLPDRVNAQDYHRFWLWGNVSPKPYINTQNKNNELYILQGEIGLSQQIPRSSKQNAHAVVSSTLENQGMGLCHIESAKIWLVYRTTTLDWHPRMMQHIIARLNSWKNSGNQVIGLQIDFDSATGQLSQYSKFLGTIRQQLPPSYQLSATGLMDWVNTDHKTILQLKSSLDEIIIQTYQGTHTVPNYQAYLPRLAKINIPFKIGLVQHGQWHPYKPIEKNKNFKGYVVFLLNAPS